MTKNFGIVAAFSKPEAAILGQQITAWLTARGYGVVQESELNQHGYASTEAIVVLGGDGLMMRAANAYPDKPLLGINFGKVGFLAFVEQQDWQQAMTALVEGRFQIEHNSTLQATLLRDDHEIDQGWAINDVVIRSGNRMLDIEVYIDGYFVNTYPGDGMIVSTAREVRRIAWPPVDRFSPQGCAASPSCPFPVIHPFAHQWSRPKKRISNLSSPTITKEPSFSMVAPCSG